MKTHFIQGYSIIPFTGPLPLDKGRLRGIRLVDRPFQIPPGPPFLKWGKGFSSSYGATKWHERISWKPIHGLDKSSLYKRFLHRGANLLRPVPEFNYSDMA